MTTYAEWRDALWDYLVSDAAPGSPVYLSLEDPLPAGLPGDAEDLCRAVQRRLVSAGAIDLDRLPPQTAPPRGLPLLALMVVAASRMADDDRVTERNYFARLRALLGLSGGGRPKGLGVGDDADLWEELNEALVRTNLVPTARPGPQGPTKYIHYPLSQVGLRKADRDRLAELFARQSWLKDRDLDQWVLWVRVVARKQELTRHLQRLLADANRQTAVAAAIHACFRMNLAAPPSPTVPPPGRSSPIIDCGVLATFDPVEGPRFYAFPRVPPRWPGGDLHLANGQRLRPEGGRFSPEIEIRPQALFEGHRWPLDQAPHEEIRLWPRPYWLLVPDPNAPDSDDFADWSSHTEVGAPFWLVFKDAFSDRLRYLNQLGLIEETRRLQLAGGITAVRAVMGEPDEAIDHPEYAAIRPRSRLSLQVVGGLISPDRNGWMDGFGPTFVAAGALNGPIVLSIEAIRGRGGVPESGPPGAVCWKPNLKPGIYRAVARVGGRDATERVVRIVGWDELRVVT